MANCSADHRYYCADVAVVEDEGKVVVIALCTACGDSFSKEFQVAKAASSISLIQKGNQK